MSYLYVPKVSLIQIGEEELKRKAETFEKLAKNFKQFYFVSTSFLFLFKNVSILNSLPLHQATASLSNNFHLNSPLFLFLLTQAIP